MRIGEMAAVTETKVETIRYYERIGLLPAPARTGGNYRAYGRAELERLSFIRRARDLGFTLGQVRELLALACEASRSCGDVDRIAREQLTAIDQKIADLLALRGELERVLESCGQATVADCRIIQMLAPKSAGSTKGIGIRDSAASPLVVSGSARP
jgi:DNA-binding transcriptional MerR regulator